MTPLTVEYFRKHGFEELTPSWTSFRKQIGDYHWVQVSRMSPASPWIWNVDDNEQPENPQTEEDAELFCEGLQ